MLHDENVANVKPIIGVRFGRLTGIARLPKKNGSSRALFKCDCGVEKEIRVSHVRMGLVRSCGCLRDEFYARNKKYATAADRDRANYTRNKGVYKARAAAHRARYRAELSDSILREKLRRRGITDPPLGLLGVYRAYLLVKRELRAKRDEQHNEIAG